ncbi:hypothetical protein [Methyloceanibacter sp.]|uniref:hypothetical protein n=1 Tax=Methyloceanibacter sp. TaxID=1965321 RepID=UPI003D6C8DB1
MIREHLKPLLDAAERVQMSPEEREEQRRSFAFGNTAIENDLITRELVDAEANKLAAEQPYVPGRNKAP